MENKKFKIGDKVKFIWGTEGRHANGLIDFVKECNNNLEITDETFGGRWHVNRRYFLGI